MGDPDRYRNEMAALLVSLEQLAVHRDLRIDPQKLVRMSPRSFYALSPWSYRIAQAMMAYVGDEVITAALRARTDAGIVQAVDRVRWSRFVGFVRRSAKGGDASAAVTVEDRVPMHEPPSSGSVIEAGARELDLDRQGTNFDWIGNTNVARISELRQRYEVARTITERTDRPVVLLAGNAPSMDATVTVWLPGHSTNPILRGRGYGTSPHAFLESIHQGLQECAGGWPFEVDAFGRKPAPINEVKPKYKYEPNEAGLARWARRWRDTNPRVVLCLAATLEEVGIEDPVAAEEAYLRELKRSGLRPTAGFVFDLAHRGPGAAKPIAHAFARLSGDQACPVAYWAPAQTR